MRMRIVLIISSFYRGENSAERCKNLSMVLVSGGDLFQVISKLQSAHLLPLEYLGKDPEVIGLFTLPITKITLKS